MKKLRRIAAMVVISLFAFSYGLFSFSASAETVTNEYTSFQGHISDNYVSIGPLNYNAQWIEYTDSGTRFIWTNLQGISSGAFHLFFNYSSPMLTLSPNKKNVIVFSVWNEHASLNTSDYNLVFSYGSSGGEGAPTYVEYGPDGWTYAAFEFNLQNQSSGITFSPVRLDYKFSKSSGSADWATFVKLTHVITTDADQAADEIIDGIVGGIVDGNGTPLVPDPGAGGAVDDIENAENAALGGKSDEQIQQDVNQALSFDINTLDQSAAAAMANYFDNLLTHFGLDYQALLLLSLSLGLAAFIIGRRYKA